MRLQKVLVLVERLCSRLQILDFVAEVLLLCLNFGAEFVEAVNFLVQLVDRLVFERVVLVLVVQFLNQGLELLLLGLHVDRVAFKVVMLLFLKLGAQLFVQVADHVVKFLLHAADFRVRLQELLEALLLVGALAAALTSVRRLLPGGAHRFHHLS